MKIEYPHHAYMNKKRLKKKENMSDFRMRCTNYA